jgi:hypothetical protein
VHKLTSHLATGQAPSNPTPSPKSPQKAAEIEGQVHRPRPIQNHFQKIFRLHIKTYLIFADPPKKIYNNNKNQKLKSLDMILRKRAEKGWNKKLCLD